MPISITCGKVLSISMPPNKIHDTNFAEKLIIGTNAERIFSGA